MTTDFTTQCFLCIVRINIYNSDNYVSKKDDRLSGHPYLINNLLSKKLMESL